MNQITRSFVLHRVLMLAVLLVYCINFMLDRKIRNIYFAKLLQIDRKANQTEESDFKRFDPFIDLTYSTPAQIIPFHSTSFSSHDCIQNILDDSRWPSFFRRTCHFSKLYYKPTDKSFHYFPTPEEREAWIIANMTEGDIFNSMSTIIGHTLEDTRINWLSPGWAPAVHLNDSLLPLANDTFSIVGPANLVFLAYQPFYSFNFGHLLIDDLFSLFNMLDIFGMIDDDNFEESDKWREAYDVHVSSSSQKQFLPVPFFIEMEGDDPMWRCSPWNWRRWPLCLNMYNKTLPYLMNLQPDESGDILRTGNWLQLSTKRGVGVPNTTYLLISELLVGTGRLNFSSRNADWTYGRGSQLYRYRLFLLHNIFGRKQFSAINSEPFKGLITFALPEGSSRPHEVWWFQNIIDALKETQWKHLINVQSMRNLTIDQQARIALDSSIYFTNHGGGSFTSLFLNRGACAFIYFHEIKRDENFYETVSHFRVRWVSAEERNNTRLIMSAIASEMNQTQSEE